MDRSLAAEIALYLADCRRRRLRPATLRAYEQALADLARSFPDPDPPLADLTLAAARRWQDARSSALSAGSLAGRIAALRTFGAWAAAEGDLAANPLARLRAPFRERRLRVVPDDAELAALLAAASPAEQVLLLVLAGTGMRVGELCRLVLDDLVEDALLVRDTKTHEDRLAPLDAALLATLRFYVAELRPLPRHPDDRHLFLTRRGAPYRPELIAALVRRDCLRAGLGARRFTPHALRHWYARDLLAHDTNPLLAAARGGWRTVAMLVHYARVSEAMLRRDTERYAPGSRIVGGAWRSPSVARYAASARPSSGRSRR